LSLRFRNSPWVKTEVRFGLSMVENPTLRGKPARFARLGEIASLNLARRMIAQSCWLFLEPAEVGRRPPVILRASARKTDDWFAR
jgi:hypothetical protein